MLPFGRTGKDYSGNIMEYIDGYCHFHPSIWFFLLINQYGVHNIDEEAESFHVKLTVIVWEKDTRKQFLLKIQILSMHVCKATIQDFDFFFKNPELFSDFEQNFNFSLFYQNLIKLIFFKNSKET
jgi:hypothetical protein